MALTITGLSKTYPNGVNALKNLSLSIGNSMFGLVGPNGAGKSSLMRTVATLQDPDSGTVHLDGLDVVANKNEVRKVLGYLPQEFGVYPKISATDMLHHLALMKGITSKGERREMVDALLQQTNLWSVRKKASMPSNESGFLRGHQRHPQARHRRTHHRHRRLLLISMCRDATFLRPKRPGLNSERLRCPTLVF